MEKLNVFFRINKRSLHWRHTGWKTAKSFTYWLLVVKEALLWHHLITHSSLNNHKTITNKKKESLLCLCVFLHLFKKLETFGWKPHYCDPGHPPRVFKCQKHLLKGRRDTEDVLCGHWDSFPATHWPDIDKCSFDSSISWRNLLHPLRTCFFRLINSTEDISENSHVYCVFASQWSQCGSPVCFKSCSPL